MNELLFIILQYSLTFLFLSIIICIFLFLTIMRLLFPITFLLQACNFFLKWHCILYFVLYCNSFHSHTHHWTRLYFVFSSQYLHVFQYIKSYSMFYVLYLYTLFCINFTFRKSPAGNSRVTRLKHEHNNVVKLLPLNYLW